MAFAALAPGASRMLERLAPPPGVHEYQNIGRPIYVAIEPAADGKHWHGTKASFERPAGTFLVGTTDSRGRNRLAFGIESYYVQEGKGLELEKLRNSKKLAAEVVVSPWGQAKLKRLIVED